VAAVSVVLIDGEIETVRRTVPHGKRVVITAVVMLRLETSPASGIGDGVFRNRNAIKLASNRRGAGFAVPGDLKESVEDPVVNPGRKEKDGLPEVVVDERIEFLRVRRVRDGTPRSTT